VAGRLRVLLDAIEAGQIEADLDHTPRTCAARRMRWRWSPTRRPRTSGDKPS